MSQGLGQSQGQNMSRGEGSSVLSSSLALQRALYRRLSGAEGLPPVYDDAPSAASLPYILIGLDEVRFEGVDQVMRSHHESRVVVFSRSAGLVEVKRILGLIYELIEGEALVLEGHRLVLSRIGEMRSRAMNDGKTFRGELVLHLLTEPE